MKLLLALDGSPNSQFALQQACARPWPIDTVIGVLSVVDPKSFDVSPAELPARIKAETEIAHQLVLEAAARLNRNQVETTTLVAEGDPRSVIIKYARLWSVDTILMGALGKSQIPKFFMGSVAKAVLRESPCSIWIARPRAEAPLPSPSVGMRVMIATDGTAEAQAAIDSVANYPWPAGSLFYVVTVAEPARSLAAHWAEPSELSSKIAPEVLEQAQVAIRAAFKSLEGNEYGLSSSVLVGYAKEAILEEAANWNADIVVVGTRGWNGIDRIRLGSVSDAIAIHAPCSVEIVRHCTLSE